MTAAPQQALRSGCLAHLSGIHEYWLRNTCRSEGTPLCWFPDTAPNIGLRLLIRPL